MRIVYGDIIVEIEPGEEERAAGLIFALNRLGLLESQQSQQHQMGMRVNVPPHNNKGECRRSVPRSNARSSRGGPGRRATGWVCRFLSVHRAASADDVPQMGEEAGYWYGQEVRTQLVPVR